MTHPYFFRQNKLIKNSNFATRMLPQYVKDHLQQEGIENVLRTYDKTTRTCYEKADLLREAFPQEGWSDDRIVKAIYALVDEKPYLFVTPELKLRNGSKKRNISGRSRRSRRILRKHGKLVEPGIIDDQLVLRLFEKSNLSASNYTPLVSPKHTYQELREEWIPEWMEYGTCTPFPKEQDFSKLRGYPGIQAVFINDVPALDDKVVDISVGGRGEEARKTSLQLPYGEIFAILKQQFPEKVYKTTFWRKSK